MAPWLVEALSLRRSSRLHFPELLLITSPELSVTPLYQALHLLKKKKNPKNS